LIYPSWLQLFFSQCQLPFCSIHWSFPQPQPSCSDHSAIPISISNGSQISGAATRKATDRPPAGTQIGLLCDPSDLRICGSGRELSNSGRQERYGSLGIGNRSTGFLMCSGISSSSKLMTSANQTDVSATAAPSPGVICVSQSSGLTYSSSLLFDGGPVAVY